MTVVAEPVVTTRTHARHRRTPATPRKMRRVLTRAASLLGTLLVLATGVVLLGMTVGPRVFHYRTATMLTGSMVPTIDPGDVIVDVREKATDIKVGQIITYHIPVDDQRVESHRVTWVHQAKNGTVLFRTKGDANAGEDPWTARATGSDIWRVRTELPLAGDVIRFMREPRIQFALTRALPVVLLGSVLLTIWRRPSARGGSAGPTP